MTKKNVMYEGNSVAFEVEEDDIRVNVTQVAKAFKKSACPSPENWLNTFQAKECLQIVANHNKCMPDELFSIRVVQDSIEVWLEGYTSTEYARNISMDALVWVRRTLHDLFVERIKEQRMRNLAYIMNLFGSNKPISIPALSGLFARVNNEISEEMILDYLKEYGFVYKARKGNRYVPNRKYCDLGFFAKVNYTKEIMLTGDGARYVFAKMMPTSK